MIELSAIEIYESGIVTSVSIPDSPFWKSLFPEIGENIVDCFDGVAKENIKKYIHQIFSSSLPVKQSLTLNNLNFNCTAFRKSENIATICWEKAPEAATDSYDNVLKNRMALVDLSFKNANTAIHFVKEDGSFYDFNEALNVMLGYTREEFFQLNIYDIIPNITEEFWKNDWKELKVRGGKTIYSQQKKKNGSLINIELKTTFINYNGIELNCAFINDITDRKKLENKLLMFDYSFKKISAPIIFFRNDGSIFDCNEAYCKLFGYEENEILNLSLFDFGAEYTKETFKHYWEKVKTQVSFSFKSHRTLRNGTVIDVEIVPNFIKFGETELICSFVKDITEQSKLERSLIEEKSLLRTLIDHLPFPVYVKDAEARKLIVNKPYQDFIQKLNLNTDVIGKNDLEIFKDLPNQIGYSQDIRVINSGLPIIEESEIYYLNKHNKRDLLTTKLPLTDGLGNTNGLVGFSIDVTEKKKLDEALKLVDFAFRRAAVAMHIVDKEGNIFDCNLTACNILGYSFEEYKALTIFEINKGITKEKFKLLWNEIAVDTEVVSYYSLSRKNNELVDVEIRSNKIIYGDLELLCTSFIDITDKKRTEERLKIVNYAFRNASISMQFLRKDGSIYDFNNRASEILGYKKEEYRNISLFDFTLRHTPESWKVRWEDLKNGNNETFIAKIKRKDNSIIDVEMRTSIINYENEELAFACTIDITDKKRIEERLKIVDYAFRNASIPMHFLRKDGSVYDFNSNTPKLLGYTDEEFPNVTLFDFSSRHSNESWNSRWDEFTKTKSQTNITKLRRKDNSLVDVEIRTDIVQYENEELAFASIIDISEKVKAEAELKKSNERYENAMIATSDIVWEADLIQDTTYFSKNFAVVFGHPIIGIEQGTDNNWRRNLHPDDQKRVLESEGKVEKGMSDKWEIEYRLKKADGNYANVLDRGFSVKDENGKVLRLIGAMQDITKRKEEESRLKLLESVVVHTNDAIVIANASPIDAPGPTIVYVNDAYSRITGYTLEESIGSNPRKLHNQNTDRKELDKLRKALENWLPCEMTVKNSRKNGEEFWANIRVAPVANEKGEYTHWVSVQRDVTKEIEAQKEKEALLNELINNNNELKQFGYITTHNLRAPLTNLVAISKLMDESMIPDDFTRKLISGFKQSTLMLNDTLNDLIKILFIKERMNLATMDLKFQEMLNKVIKLISNTIESKNVVIESDFSAAPTVKFSSIYLESLFLNLITNAVKYAHPYRSPIINISTTILPDNKVKFIFSDNGIGMNMDRIKGRIFGLYQRFHNNADSKGLGLYLIHSQVTALGGTIDVESKVNVGTKFTIIFKNAE